MSNRVFKKLVTPFTQSNPTAAIISVNLTDLQISTINVFIEAVKQRGIPYFIVGNKKDVAKKQVIDTVKQEYGDMLISSFLNEDDITIIADTINATFERKSRIIVLGVFNSGKTTLINALSNSNHPINDIPGTTVEFTETDYNGHVLIDSVGQLIDINKPLMYSVDLSDCNTVKEKLVKVMQQESDGILSSIETAQYGIINTVDALKQQIDTGHKLIIIGAGASALVAKAMAGQATELTIPAIVFTNDFSEIQPISFSKGIGEEEAGLSKYITRTINEGDCCIAISASGGTGFVYHTLDLAKQKGAITVAITENLDTPLGKHADYIVKSSGKPEGPSSSKIMCAHLSICHTLNILLADSLGVNADKAINCMLPERVPSKLMGIK